MDNKQNPSNSRRAFVKTSAKAAIISAAGMPLMGALSSCESKKEEKKEEAKEVKPQVETFSQIALPYAFDALAPNIDAMTMEIHYGKHHAGYVKKLNAAVQKEQIGGSLEAILANVSQYSTAVRNNGGGHYNHNMFWQVMSPNGGGVPTGKLAAAIDQAFGSFEEFKEQFSKAAATRFGSGWAWLVKNGTQLSIGSTPNQDNPLMDVAEIKGTPLLNLDVWEHAYYLNYQNMRGSYIENFWKVVNWEEVSKRFES
ncbi:superoxide dismutase [Persicobacter diffluens]|uniref:Superoxide dismutase n=1 Tax=Persicobacter diffluens TaxID=981 RepID=A0AAN4VWQ6_9BACT|nr:hypothetical protein PEDI_02570 [Persicobacter diffluens]